MSCTEWRRLVESYRTAVHAYDKAVAELADGSDVRFDQAWQRAETARRNAEGARADLIQHEHEHACGAGSDAMSNYQLREGHLETAAVRLFNVNTECWETIEAAVHGQPPSGALAYQASQTPEAAQWIIDPKAFKESRQRGAGLLYAEAGLKILRDDGLENVRSVAAACRLLLPLSHRRVISWQFPVWR
jgi:hypothetical protein